MGVNESFICNFYLSTPAGSVLHSVGMMSTYCNWVRLKSFICNFYLSTAAGLALRSVGMSVYCNWVRLKKVYLQLLSQYGGWVSTMFSWYVSILQLHETEKVLSATSISVQQHMQLSSQIHSPEMHFTCCCNIKQPTNNHTLRSVASYRNIF